MNRRRAISLDAELLEEAERRVEATGGDLSAFVSAALRRELLARPRAQPSTDASALAAHAAEYLDAVLARDTHRARRVVETALLAGVSVADMYTEVFRPALHEVGHKWALEEINVAQEHFATTITQTLIATLAPESRAVRADGRLAVVTGTPEELHLLGAQMVADLLEREGWEVLSLGAATPAPDLVELVELECPDLVALSASTAGRLPGVAEVLPRLAAVRPRPLIAVGGGLFTGDAAEVARDLGADLVVSDVRALLATLRERFPAQDAEASTLPGRDRER